MKYPLSSQEESMNRNASNLIMSLLSFMLLAWGMPAQAADPDLIDVVEIVGTNPIIVEDNILPGDSFNRTITVNNLTSVPQDIIMKLTIDTSQGIVWFPNFELERRLLVSIRKADNTLVLLPGGVTEKSLYDLGDSVIALGSVPGNDSRVFTFLVSFDRDAGNEYQRTRVYFNLAMSVETVPTSPRLTLRKSNDSVAPEAPGNSVLYTLQVTAGDEPLSGVEVTDLPPAGFVYEPGSGTGAPFIHEYASPGVWNVGDLAAGETRTLTYRTTISTVQDDGLYQDLAWAKGRSGEEMVFANADEASSFVGTTVAVVTPTAQVVTLDEKTKTDTTTKKKIKQVLGAATVLPATGAQVAWIVLALATAMLGLGMMFWAKRRGNTAVKTFLLFLFGVSILTLPAAASAATDPHISVRIEAPESPSMESVFKIGFVTLDIKGRSLSAQCYQVGDIPVTTEYVPKAGGNSGSCLVDVPDGTYQFYVKTYLEDEEESSVENVSETVTVVVRAGTPGTPINYNRGKNSCGVAFTTANDTLTAGVELYRSSEATFVADAATLVMTQPIGPNTAGTLIDPTADCGGHNFYALRAISVAGAGSGFVGDEDVTVKHKTKSKTVIETIPGPVGVGALSVAGSLGAGVGSAGAVQGAETESGEAAGGQVLGEETENNPLSGSFREWALAHPGQASFLALLGLILVFFGYGLFRKRYE